MKTAFITGISGQDGAYLSRFLLGKGYSVIGGDRRTASGSLWRLDKLGILKDVIIEDFELSEFTNIYRSIDKHNICEFYNLAAQSFVGASFEMPTMTADISGMGVLRVLEAIRQVNPEIKFYQASSSEMFGKVREVPQNETTPFYPRSPYAIAKVFGHWCAVNYRESFNMYCSSGILFNHESPLRGNEFVTKKIVNNVKKIIKGEQDYFEIGNLNAKRDWGYAPEYVEMMWKMLQLDKADDFVIATGENHSVRELIEYAFMYVGVDIKWQGKGNEEHGIDVKSNKIRVKINKKYYRPAEVDSLIGDASKAKSKLNWQTKTKFKDLVSIMMSDSLEC